MAALLFAVNLQHVSALPEDVMVNTFTIATASAGYVEGEADLAAVDIFDFYNTVPPPAAGEVNQYMSPMVKRGTNVHTINVYDLSGHLDGTPHGSPKKSYPMSMDASGAALGEPSELAICLTIKASYAGDAEFSGLTRPRARDRGRIYIGPLNRNAVEHDGIGRPRVAGVCRDTIAAAATVLMNSTNGAWSVWSRKNATVEPVVGGWIDNAFDIIRGRGEDSTFRTTWGSQA